MYYAPVLITTLNRYESFRKSIESLARNNWARYTDLIIAVDYPKNEKHKEGNAQILAYLSGDIHGFKSIKVIKRHRNYGAIGNFESLVEEVFEKYNRCICTFDDLEHSPNFIEYMDKILSKYEGNPEIVGVTGYSYPVSWAARENCSVVRQNFVGSIWGIGFWRESFKTMKKYLNSRGLINSFDQAYENAFPGMTDWAIKDYVINICNGYGHNSFLTRITDISMRIYLSVENKYFIMPLLSKVRNLGFDGSGEFCEKIDSNDNDFRSNNYSYKNQIIDLNDSFELVEDENFDLNLNKYLMNQFDFVDVKTKKVIRNLAAEYHARGKMNRFMLNIKHNSRRIIGKLVRIFH